MAGINIRTLSAALQKKAEEEINETPESLRSGLDSLRNWINESPHLGLFELPDQWLVSILRGTKYDLKKSKNKLEKYYSLKDVAPEFYTNRDPFDPKIQELLKLGLFLPVRNVVKEDSPRVCLVRVAQLPKTEYRLVDLIKVAFMIVEILILEDDNFSVAGIDLISDMDKTGFLVLTQWNPFIARKSLICSEGALAVRIKSLNIINSPRGINAAITIFRMFLSTKLKNRIQVFSHNYEGLYEYVPDSVLPAEYGGNDGNLKDLTDYWKVKVESYRDWFLQQEI